MTTKKGWKKHRLRPMSREETAVLERLSDAAKKKFEEVESRIWPPVSAARLWDDHFSPKLRSRCGKDLDSAWKDHGTLGLWMKAYRERNRFVALAKLGFQLGFLTSTQKEWLLRQAALVRKVSDEGPELPVWDRHAGILCFRGKLIRKLRLNRHRSGMREILDAFQDADWPTAIENPLSDDEPQKLHRSVHRLNDGLKAIRFSVKEGARSISWTSLAARQTKPTSRKRRAKGK